MPPIAPDRLWPRKHQYRISGLSGALSSEHQMLSAGDVEQILESGGSVKLSGFSVETLMHLAYVARKSGVRLDIDARGLSPDCLYKIAEAGRGHVYFDLTV
jgi:hypothetical protein